jgi:hypothetical protein
LSFTQALGNSGVSKITFFVIFSFFLTILSLAMFTTFFFVVTITVSIVLAFFTASTVAKSLKNDNLPSHASLKRKQAQPDFSVSFGFPLAVLILVFAALNLAAFVSMVSSNFFFASGASAIFLVVFFLLILSRVSKISDLFSSLIPQQQK